VMFLFILAVSLPFLREIKLVQTVEIPGQIFCHFLACVPNSLFLGCSCL